MCKGIQQNIKTYKKHAHTNALIHSQARRFFWFVFVWCVVVGLHACFAMGILQVCVRMCIPNACVYTHLHACCAGGGTLIKLYPCVRVRTRQTQRPMQPLCPYIHTHVQSRLGRPMGQQKHAWYKIYMRAHTSNCNVAFL